jgi:hypothetical protein
VYCSLHCNFEGVCTNSIALSPISESHVARALHTASECACPEWTDRSIALLAEAIESVNMTIRSQFSSIVALLTAIQIAKSSASADSTLSATHVEVYGVRPARSMTDDALAWILVLLGTEQSVPQQTVPCDALAWAWMLLRRLYRLTSAFSSFGS